MPRPAITDLRLITRDLEEAIEFYTEKLAFDLDHRMPDFADFAGPSVTRALRDAQHIRQTTEVPAQASESEGHGVMVAVRLETPAAIDEMHSQLQRRGVACSGPPTDYPWNARAICFAGPCGEFWEFYAWHQGGAPGYVE